MEFLLTLRTGSWARTKVLRMHCQWRHQDTEWQVSRVMPSATRHRKRVHRASNQVRRCIPIVSYSKTRVCWWWRLYIGIRKVRNGRSWIVNGQLFSSLRTGKQGNLRNLRNVNLGTIVVGADRRSGSAVDQRCTSWSHWLRWIRALLVLHHAGLRWIRHLLLYHAGLRRIRALLVLHHGLRRIRTLLVLHHALRWCRRRHLHHRTRGAMHCIRSWRLRVRR